MNGIILFQGFDFRKLRNKRKICKRANWKGNKYGGPCSLEVFLFLMCSHSQAYLDRMRTTSEDSADAIDDANNSLFYDDLELVFKRKL